jgi:hypothetical protein
VASPAPPPAPAPAPAPMVAAPAAPERPPPALPTTGTVLVSGDASSVWLVGADGGRVEVGAVPPGEYTLKAAFGGDPVSLRLEVRAGATSRVRCDAAFAMCRPQP